MEPEKFSLSGTGEDAGHDGNSTLYILTLYTLVAVVAAAGPVLEPSVGKVKQ